MLMKKGKKNTQTEQQKTLNRELVCAKNIHKKIKVTPTETKKNLYSFARLREKRNNTKPEKK